MKHGKANEIASAKTAKTGELKLEGGITNLTNKDIAMCLHGACGTFGATGELVWKNVDLQSRLVEIGRLNGVFTLMEPTIKFRKEDAIRVLERISMRRRSVICQILQSEAKQTKGRPANYYIVPLETIMIAQATGKSLEYLLLPAGEDWADGRLAYAGFVLARRLFENVNYRAK